jgi:hypothetical protein
MKEAIRHNENKIRYDLCPAIAQREYAKVWTQGLEKYPERNWAFALSTLDGKCCNVNRVLFYTSRTK